MCAHLLASACYAIKCLYLRPWKDCSWTLTFPCLNRVRYVLESPCLTPPPPTTQCQSDTEAMTDWCENLKAQFFCLKIGQTLRFNLCSRALHRIRLRPHLNCIFAWLLLFYDAASTFLLVLPRTQFFNKSLPHAYFLSGSASWRHDLGHLCYDMLYIYMKWVKWKLLSRVQLFATPWTEACQAPLSMGLSRQG